MIIELLDQIQAFTHLPSYGTIVGACIGTVQLLYVMTHVFHYNYHHYIQHGIILVNGSDNKDEIKETLKTLGKKESPFAVGYFPALLLNLFLGALWVVTLHFWYVTIPIASVVFFIILPGQVIKFIARKKRKKVIFEKKLSGTHNERV